MSYVYVNGFVNSTWERVYKYEKSFEMCISL